MIELPKCKYNGRIREEVIGVGENAIKIGGETALPFHTFEGEIPNPPKIALEVYDIKPVDWAPACLEPFRDVLDDPVAWAKKCVEEYKAELVCLQLVSTDPTGENRSAEEAAEIAKKVTDAVPVPVIVYGSGNVEKDGEVLKSVSSTCEGKNILLGPAKEENYKVIGASAIGYKHLVSALTPIDVNLCKQLNILLGNLGVQDDRIVIDPTTGGLGYGLEYTYSVMERGRLAALIQGDQKMQMPMICNLGREAWKVKEVRIEDPNFGDIKKRGIIWEAITAISLCLAGANILVMRHPESAALVKEIIDELLGIEKKEN
ncbi:MAG: CO dehydrogenase/acetyl-CoA synthase subunit delta [bacterium]|nr:CO dehydrogenase/acetyl-CoA synthase subunit delta [bacterium]